MTINSFSTLSWDLKDLYEKQVEFNKSLITIPKSIPGDLKLAAEYLAEVEEEIINILGDEYLPISETLAHIKLCHRKRDANLEYVRQFKHDVRAVADDPEKLVAWLQSHHPRLQKHLRNALRDVETLQHDINQLELSPLEKGVLLSKVYSTELNLNAAEKLLEPFAPNHAIRPSAPNLGNMSYQISMN